MDKQKERPPLFDIGDTTLLSRPVNVASVRQLSPFRYPGGKTWFVPFFRRWMASLKKKPEVLIEPFAGGGIISLTALFENLVQRVVMVELDDEVAAVWETIVEGGSEWLAYRITTFTMTRETLEEELRKVPVGKREKAFQTILKNRTLYGGILAPGSRFIRKGEGGRGIASRWYPKTIAKRLIDLDRIADRIDFRHDDGLRVIQEFADREDVVFFIDPPYTAGKRGAGRRLYKYHQVDHEYLFKLCQSLKGDFLMTYNETREVEEMAHRYGFQVRAVPMKNTHHAIKRELIIGKNLDWIEGLAKLS